MTDLGHDILVFIDPALLEVFLACAGLLLLAVGALVKVPITRVITYAVMVSLVAGIFIVLRQDWTTTLTFNDLFIWDVFAAFIKILLLGGMVTVLALSLRYIEEEGINHFEYPVLALFATLGMLVMVSANDLMSLYIGLELQSLSLYVLAAIRRSSGKSAEAGLKYFILGALSSGMVLFGSSLIYGFAGTTNFSGIAAALEVMDNNVGISMGLMFLLAGIAFKVSLAPFHMWTPDVYEGAPTSVTALFAIVPKLAAIALLMRILLGPFAEVAFQWSQVLWILSIASMCVGAFAALTQENMKRLLAYSSIGNMGYAIMGLVAGTPDGAGSIIFYTMLYMIMSAGVFGIIISLRRGGISVDKIEGYSGLSQTHPVSAYALAILMFSMSGIPPFAGFFGKLFVFQAAVEAGYIYLAVIGVLTSVVAAFYYLRVVKVMFFDEAVETLEKDNSVSRITVVMLSLVAVIGLIAIPQPLLLICRSAAFSLF
jgi:NADH-quinone oxidoreductase subunit N